MNRVREWCVGMHKKFGLHTVIDGWYRDVNNVVVCRLRLGGYSDDLLDDLLAYSYGEFDRMMSLYQRDNDFVHIPTTMDVPVAGGRILMDDPRKARKVAEGIGHEYGKGTYLMDNGTCFCVSHDLKVRFVERIPHLWRFTVCMGDGLWKVGGSDCHTGVHNFAYRYRCRHGMTLVPWIALSALGMERLGRGNLYCSYDNSLCRIWIVPPSMRGVGHWGDRFIKHDDGVPLYVVPVLGCRKGASLYV